jgi:hypothetical protein
MNLQILLLGMVLALAKRPVSPDDFQGTNLILPLTFMGIALAFTSLIIRRALLSDQRLAQFLKKPRDPMQFAEVGVDAKKNEVRKQLIDRLSPGEKKVLALHQWVFAPFLISLFLNEGVALMGFILAFQYREIVLFVPFGALALLLNLWMFPRLAPYQERAILLLSMNNS